MPVLHDKNLRKAANNQAVKRLELATLPVSSGRSFSPDTIGYIAYPIVAAQFAAL
jgi:hypothetical protein